MRTARTGFDDAINDPKRGKAHFERTWQFLEKLS
ncbi:hypothetical protein MAA5396_03355 [Marinovum algicola]|nr:hypothetical protein MAA5396_03355 [Marinovum algicola]